MYCALLITVIDKPQKRYLKSTKRFPKQMKELAQEIATIGKEYSSNELYEENVKELIESQLEELSDDLFNLEGLGAYKATDSTSNGQILTTLKEISQKKLSNIF